MKAAVLLSASRHATSGRPAPTRAELQALELGLSLGAETIGLHAGPDAAAARTALGHGLERLVHLDLPDGVDPVPALAAELSRLELDLVLCSPRSVGGDETGLVPYRLAAALGWPILADVAALAVEDGMLAAVQALPKGVRRRIREGLPLVLTVASSAPPPRAYAFAAERRGIVERRAGLAGDPGEPLAERPARRRAKLLRSAPAGGSAADRLRAATEAARGGGGELLVAPDPEDAARAVLAHLRRIGAFEPRP